MIQTLHKITMLGINTALDGIQCVTLKLHGVTDMSMRSNISKHGGKRANSGRKPKGARVVGKQIRIGVSNLKPRQIAQLLDAINKMIAEMKGGTA